MKVHRGTAVVAVCCLAMACVCTMKEGISRAEFLQTLLKGYDSRIAPEFDSDRTTDVKIRLYISSFDSVNEQTMDYSLSTFITQTWKDKRLKFFGFIDASYLELDVKLIDSIWIPDLYFANEKKASFHEVTVPNRMLHIYSDGTIVFRSRVSLTVACPMKLHNYPFDTQRCHLYMQSFTYSMKKLRFSWDRIPITVSPTIVLPQFRLVGNRTENCTYMYGEGNFTCLKASFLLKRDIGYYMIQIYIPSILIVFLSWVSFYLNVNAVPARISLGILTVLTLTTQRTAGAPSLPKVSYIKAIDVWMASCLGFVFAALLEFAVVNVLERRLEKSATSSIKDKDAEQGTSKEVEICSNRKTRRVHGLRWIQAPLGKQKAVMMDYISRIIFPLAFIIFSAIYWLIYGAQADSTF